MFEFGHQGFVLRIDLTTRKYRPEPLSERDVAAFLGARGLAARFYYDEIGPEVDAFDPANRIIMMTGPLTGVRLPSTTKIALSTKSPETGHYLCTNSGGDFGPQLKFCGFDGLILQGQSDEWTFLLITGDGNPFHVDVYFMDARRWLGQTTNETLDTLRQVMDDGQLNDRPAGCGALAIGPAGERLVRIAYTNVDTRALGRGGSGAVFGSKRVKGIGVRGGGAIPVADPERVTEIRRAAIAELRETRATHTRYGTPQYIEVINELGCMPTRNFQTAHFEGASTIDAHTMREDYWVRNYGCYQCPVACGKVCQVKDGPYAGARARVEFETIGLLGPNCGVDDFGAIVTANELCDDIGIDTMSAGNAVALAMELFERGMITTDDTDGIEARFGSAEALIGLIRLLGERRAIGDLLAEGMAGVLRAHPEWSPYVLAVKGMPFAAYDPRGFTGNALTYGTSNRGACHNVGGWTIRAELQSGQYDRFALAGKGALVKRIQDNRAYVDSLGLCTVVRGSMDYRENPQSDALEAVTGHPFTPDLMKIGERIYNLERMILNREGVRRKDDLLPERITSEAIPSGPTQGRTLTADAYALMLDEYYRARGWTVDGVPTRETRRRLGLSRV